MVNYLKGSLNDTDVISAGAGASSFWDDVSGFLSFLILDPDHVHISHIEPIPWTRLSCTVSTNKSMIVVRRHVL
jgi:hypothetical protein